MVYRPIWYLVQAHTEKLYQVPISGWRKFSERTISERLQSLEALDAVLCRLVGEIHRSVSVLKLGSEVWTDVEAKTKQIRAHIFAMIEAVSDADLERLNLMSVDNVPRGSEVSMADFEEIVHSNTLAVRSCVFKISSIPRWWRRNWLPATTAVFAGVGLTIAFYKLTNSDSDGFSTWALSRGEFARDFINDRMLEPLLHIYSDLISDSDDTEKQVKSAKDARDSLHKMILDFVQTKSNDPSHLESAKLVSKLRNSKDVTPLSELLTSALCQGDMTLVMKTIEEQMAHPFRNLVAGYLTQAMLIQVQRIMVQLEEDMTSVKQLMRANEINLWISSLAPAGIIIVLLGWLMTISNRRLMRERTIDKMSSTIRGAAALHDIDRNLQLYSSCADPEKLNDEKWLMCNTRILVQVAILEQALVTYMNRHGKTGESRSLLLEDLETLRLYLVTPKTKLETLSRMRHSFIAIQQMKL
uniref:Nuclear control of ATPase protein 2 n=1 Tax=Rhodosorus marinus TaxID=101924 RepID=A0A7S3ECM0_9RHOD|mmetsp:Transcript_2510/g.10973  ORF Transcript_2510/g.10973 Transcript_2510/m.10973 type:complete len:470 (+) Transcript_2510:871-2280(+)